MTVMALQPLNDFSSFQVISQSPSSMNQPHDLSQSCKLLKTESLMELASVSEFSFETW